jgi:hypothetical protein
LQRSKTGSIEKHWAGHRRAALSVAVQRVWSNPMNRCEKSGNVRPTVEHQAKGVAILD